MFFGDIINKIAKSPFKMTGGALALPEVKGKNVVNTYGADDTTRVFSTLKPESQVGKSPKKVIKLYKEAPEKNKYEKGTGLLSHISKTVKKQKEQPAGNLIEDSGFAESYKK
jgi:hypothetical protein